MFSHPNTDGETRSAEELLLAVEADLRLAEPGFAWTPEGRHMAEKHVRDALASACYSRALAVNIVSSAQIVEAQLACAKVRLGKCAESVQTQNLKKRILHSIVRVLAHPPTSSDATQL